MTATGAALKRIPFVVNMGARRAKDWTWVAGWLRELGLLIDPVLVTNPSLWVARVAEQVGLAPPALLLGGGDGSLSSAISPLLWSGIPAAFIPLGTGNGIPRSFGINSLGDACRCVIDGRVVSAPVGRANGAYFLNMASAGMSVDITRGVDPGLKRLIGRGAYPLSVAHTLLRRRGFSLVVETEDERMELLALQVIVFDGAYVPRFPGLGFVRPLGSLTVCTLPAGPTMQLGIALLAFLAGWRLGRAQIVCHAGAHLRIMTDPPLDVNVDGEIIRRTPLVVDLLPDALRVLVPSNYTPE